MILHLPAQDAWLSNLLSTLCLWCPGTESNRHDSFESRDFKSRASASFATRAVERDPHPERLCGHAIFQSSIENIIGASCRASADQFQLGERVQVPSGGRSH